MEKQVSAFSTTRRKSVPAEFSSARNSALLVSMVGSNFSKSGKGLFAETDPVQPAASTVSTPEASASLRSLAKALVSDMAKAAPDTRVPLEHKIPAKAIRPKGTSAKPKSDAVKRKIRKRPLNEFEREHPAIIARQIVERDHAGRTKILSKLSGPRARLVILYAKEMEKRDGVASTSDLSTRAQVKSASAG
ncbi:hypothetical protein [Litoreibacter roseus]|uniref:Uncharacterized protein n=1 Tax=Litoreibacter roseus TaxID=2601869 RepID=A0A6N6JDG4_9RHOB|nr:hypothetical protein [Litoreibacter roseus]GFE64393.1 hypothetical protein KIN_14670 [Litoreibacter roseus]